MLKSFFIQNVQSISSSMISLEFAETRAPRNNSKNWYYSFIEPVKKVRLVPILGLYGDINAIRENYFFALKTIHSLVLNQNDLFKLYRPYKNDEPAKFILEFYLGTDLFTYSIEFNDQEILQESLYKNEIKIYKLNHGQENLIGLVDDGNFSKEVLTEIWEEYVESGRFQNSFLSTLLKSDSGSNSSIDRLKIFFTKGFLVFDMEEIVQSEKFNFLPDFDDLQEILEKSQKFLAEDELNLDMLDEKINKKEVESSSVDYASNKDIIDIRVYSSFDLVEFDEQINNAFIKLTVLATYAIKHGSVLAIYGMDDFIPLLSFFSYVLKFIDKNINHNSSQLIFSFNIIELIFLDAIRKSEFAIITTDDSKQIICKRLSDFTGINKRDFNDYFCAACSEFFNHKNES